MKKIVFLSVVFLFVFAGLSAAEPVILKVKSSVANVRVQPEGSSQVITQLKQGTEIEAKAKNGNWYEVTVAGADGKIVTGFIHMSTVEVVGAEVKAEPEEQPEPARTTRTARSYTSTASESRSASGFKIMGGLSLGDMTFSEPLDPAITKKYLMGFGGGIAYDMSFGSMFGLEIGALYVPGGCRFALTGGHYDFVGNAIVVPILLQVRFMSGFTPVIFAGGQIGYVLSAKIKIVPDVGVGDEEDELEYVNRLYYGLVFGAGVEIPLGSMTLVIEGRYNLGLSNIIKDPDPGDWAKLHAITVMLGIKI